MLHELITRDIIGAAMAVLNELKPGLDEKLYENALVIELRARGHIVEQQSRHPVHYRGHLIGTLVPDVIVDGKVIADPKVVTAFNDTHTAKMVGYMNITGLQVALLLSFKEAKLNWKRLANERRNETGEDPTANRGWTLRDTNDGTENLLNESPWKPWTADGTNDTDEQCFRQFPSAKSAKSAVKKNST